MKKEYTEPTNEQLANFMVVYARTNPRFDILDVNAGVLEAIFDHNDRHRQTCLKIHRDFQERINELSQKMMDGTLQCEHIRANGKRCPNYNQPGSNFCGLHQD